MSLWLVKSIQYSLADYFIILLQALLLLSLMIAILEIKSVSFITKLLHCLIVDSNRYNIYVKTVLSVEIQSILC